MSQSVGERLLALERELLDPQTRANPETVGRLLALDFVEIGQSGRRYDRDQILFELSTEAAGKQVHILDFSAELLAPGIAMATFRTVARLGEAQTEAARVSLWRRTDQGWQVFYHQGTTRSD